MPLSKNCCEKKCSPVKCCKRDRSCSRDRPRSRRNYVNASNPGAVALTVAALGAPGIDIPLIVASPNRGFTSNGVSLIVNKTGIYEISLAASITNTSTTAPFVVALLVRQNSVEIPTSRIQASVPLATAAPATVGTAALAKTIIAQLNKGDVVALNAQVVSGTILAPTSLAVNFANLAINKIADRH